MILTLSEPEHETIRNNRQAPKDLIIVIFQHDVKAISTCGTFPPNGSVPLI
jgi:hypothetical protein